MRLCWNDIPWLLLLVFKAQGIENSQEDQDRPCIPRDFGRGSIVCVCNSTYCDFHRVTLFTTTTPQQQPHDGGGGPSRRTRFPPVQVWTSSKSGSRLHKSIIYFNMEGKSSERAVIYDSQHFLGPTDRHYHRNRNKNTTQQQPFTTLLETDPHQQHHFHDRLEFTDSVTSKYVPPLNEISWFYYVGDFPRPNKLTKFTIRQDVEYQAVLGFGGAFTDATGINMASLSKEAQRNLMRSYFDRDGNDYSMGRVPIGGTDFSPRTYTYDDMVDHLGGKDLNLTSFSLQQEDFKLKIPFIQWAQQIRNTQNNGPLRLIASPWSAPAWMKTNNRLSGRGALRPEYYQLWADYYKKFLASYHEEGIDIWGVTTGNEPLNGLIPNWPFNCMGWSASDMRKWIANNLGPTIASLKPGLDVKIITLDDSKGAIPTWASKILDHKDSAKYVDGIGTHWYYDFFTGSDVISRFHKKYPEYFIVQTEACLGFTPWELEKVILGSWERGEQYLEAIIRDLRNFVGGWIDWNLALDLDGGPNWAKWYADAAILVNSKEDEFFKQPVFYAMGHVSKFVPPGSVRIDIRAKNGPRNLFYTAFRRPDNAVAIILLNRLHYAAKVEFFDPKRGTLRLSVPKQSFQTILYQ